MYNAVNINGTIIFLHPSNIQTTEDDGYFVEIDLETFFYFARNQRASSYPLDLVPNPKDCVVLIINFDTFFHIVSTSISKSEIFTTC